MISLWNKDVVGLDIVCNEYSLMQENLILYDGTTFPFRDNYFDTVICNYTLHHTDNPIKILKEIQRVTKKNIIIVEETHDNFLQKISSIFFDWIINKKAGQKVQIKWKSYFSRSKIRKAFKSLNLKIEKESIKINRNYWVEYFELNK